ncbi:MAG: class I SAM-dependent methyltransferase [Candidatus Omnitrophica bacterium]|nr:class I SAM-dependent methyltransferase [Candidatus Omnitrophota bacterium]
MISLLKQFLKKFVKIKLTPKKVFLTDHYQRINQRRQEHLASLGLKLSGLTVLEVGAGIGDHTGFFLDRGCQITSTDAREENLNLLRSRHPNVTVKRLNMDQPDHALNDVFDMVYCYGLLYHLRHPAEAIQFMARHCRNMLLLETCVSFNDGDAVNSSFETSENPAFSFSGHCCRPTRKWVQRELKRHFEFVYLPLTQPNHVEFPADWVTPPSGPHLTRSIFIASREKLINPLLTEEIPRVQTKH